MSGVHEFVWVTEGGGQKRHAKLEQQNYTMCGRRIDLWWSERAQKYGTWKSFEACKACRRSVAAEERERAS